MSPMQAAIESAQSGMQAGEGGPFGAAVVQNGKIISTGHNTVLKDNDPTCHAEVNAIRAASQVLKTWNLTGCQLYSTADPCPMCFGAIHWARLSAVHVGASKETVAAYGWDDVVFLEQLNTPPAQRLIPTTFGIEVEACTDLFVQFEKLSLSKY